MIDWKELLIRNLLFQKLYLVISLAEYFLRRLFGDDFGAYCVTLRYERIARTVSGWHLSVIIRKINLGFIELIKSGAKRNMLVDKYMCSGEAKRYREEFRSYGIEYQIRLKYPKASDSRLRQGDVLLLKPRISKDEKGVLLIQYNESFKKFVSIFDVDRVAESYRLVLEPSTWGYCDPSILFFLGLKTDVIVQAQHHLDFEYIQSIKSNLVPLRLGAGDWVDSDNFSAGSSDTKEYDIVMIASWQRIKRHRLLFRSLQEAGDKVGKVALIGYPSEGRGKEDIINEAIEFGVLKKLKLFEAISRKEVADIVRRSKMGVMLTIREGSNKGIYEYLFSDIPIIITNRNIGVNRDHINKYTGIAVEDHELAKNIQYLIENLNQYHPREWALKHTGYRYANGLLNECLKQLSVCNGEKWTQDIFIKKNDTNSQYVFDKEQSDADKMIKDLHGLLRA